MIALLRTSPKTKENHRHGLTQFLIECKTPGITIRPIINLTGAHDFNEVVFDDAFVPDLASDRRSRHGVEAGDRRTGL